MEQATKMNLTAQAIFVILLASLIFAGCSSSKDKYKVNTDLALKWERAANIGDMEGYRKPNIFRSENKEAICYVYIGFGISCFSKSQAIN